MELNFLLDEYLKSWIERDDELLYFFRDIKN